MQSTDPRVLYIGGSGRSGSTLLDRMLGQLPGVFSVGELRLIWREGLLENRLCGCGTPFLECHFWAEVGGRAFGGWDRVEAAAVVRLEKAVSRQRFLPFLLAPKLRPAYSRKLDAYSRLLGRLYEGIREVAGARIIVDSSKDPAYAFVLRRVPNVDLRAVHLVRDSRGVAFSSAKRSPGPGTTERLRQLPRFHPLDMSFRWLIYNLLVELLAASGTATILVRYETLVQSPREEIVRVAQHHGGQVEDEALAFVKDRELELETNHTVSGNPMRLGQGRMPFQLDEEWKKALARPYRDLVTLVTWPLLRRYGYLH